jgi:hypothetical protein
MERKSMTENDKIALLETLNDASKILQHVIEVDDLNKYFKLKSGLHGIIHELIKDAESRGYKVIWEGKKAVKIVENEDKEDDKR